MMTFSRNFEAKWNQTIKSQQYSSIRGRFNTAIIFIIKRWRFSLTKCEFFDAALLRYGENLNVYHTNMSGEKLQNQSRINMQSWRIRYISPYLCHHITHLCLCEDEWKEHALSATLKSMMNSKLILVAIVFSKDFRKHLWMFFIPSLQIVRTNH